MSAQPSPAFCKSAAWYDAIYAARPWDAEVARIERFIGSPTLGGTPSVVDWGCGTGQHARRLISKGYIVIGLEPCEDMRLIAGRNGVPVADDALGRYSNVLSEIRCGHDRGMAHICMFAAINYAGVYHSTKDIVGDMLRYRPIHVVFTFLHLPAVVRGLHERASQHTTLPDGRVLARETVKHFDPMTSVLHQVMEYRLGGAGEACVEEHEMRAFTIDEVIRAFPLEAKVSITDEAGGRPTLDSWYCWCEARLP